MVTTRSQSLSSRLQKSKDMSNDTVSRRAVTRSQTLNARSTSPGMKCHSAPVVETKYVRKHTTSPYANPSKRMNTRSNAKRFLELSDHKLPVRMTRSMSNFVEKYSGYTGMKTRSMTACM